jgi:hypothetical protein
MAPLSGSTRDSSITPITTAAASDPQTAANAMIEPPDIRGGGSGTLA